MIAVFICGPGIIKEIKMIAKYTRRGFTQAEHIIVAQNKGILSLQALPRLSLVGVNNVRAKFQTPKHYGVGPKEGRPFVLKGGFTLVELLVTVLIIGILAAVAVPQYQKAVLKSRYNAMMPLAKALADANEVYFLESGNYTEKIQELPATGQENYVDGTRVLLNDNSGLSFVSVMNDNVPNAQYVVYQKYSENFPGATMCEAGDARARALCVSLGGTPLNGTSTRNSSWTAYLLGETGQTGTFPPVDLIAGKSHAKGRAVLVDGQWEYEWSDGDTFTGDPLEMNICTANAQYDCAGATFQGNSTCMARTTNGCVDSLFKLGGYCFSYKADGCAGSTFSGYNSYCVAYTGANACANTFITGEKAYCFGRTANGCANSTMSGLKSFCLADAANGCSGAIIQAGSFCQARTPDGCKDAKYGEDPTGKRSGIGACYDDKDYCPEGAPIRGDWSGSNDTGSYTYTWKGGYCNPDFMVSGKCPAGAPTTTQGQCWDGSGNQIACE